MIFQPGIHVGPYLDLEAGHSLQRGRHQPGPPGDAAIDLADGHFPLVARLAGQNVHHVPIPVARRGREADQHAVGTQRLDQRGGAGRVVHEEQHVGDVRVGSQDRKQFQRLVFAHDDQREIVGIFGPELFDQRHAVCRPLIRLHVVEDDAVLAQVVQPPAARQQRHVVPALVQASRKQAAQGA